MTCQIHVTASYVVTGTDLPLLLQRNWG